MARQGRRTGLLGQLSFLGLFDRKSGESAGNEDDLNDAGKRETKDEKDRLAQGADHDRNSGDGEQVRGPQEELPGSGLPENVRGAGADRAN